MSSDVFIRYPDLRTKKGLPWTRQYLSRMEKLGRFPQKVKLGERTVGWWESDIDAWLASKAAA